MHGDGFEIKFLLSVTEICHVFFIPLEVTLLAVVVVVVVLQLPAEVLSP